nr:hypothetical protein Iba_chr02aCG11590 [Ipomoea batatas]GMC60881.1 hypothetical protein Iba_chr02bCG14790 [Ipomoea batatas]GMC66811.1 hypothetical protein Iba_chr02eCG9130 [Ipomoea batatas]GMC68239.1 hypothetical protein Iba_chr02fCG9990 [Ipomoea batatas]GMC71564.1 hypothetical protein Iba_scaffold33696CG0090 [Ipomoea batatas]
MQLWVSTRSFIIGLQKLWAGGRCVDRLRWSSKLKVKMICWFYKKGRSQLTYQHI